MKVGAATGAMLLLPWGRLAGTPAQAADALDSGVLTKYKDALPIPKIMQPVGMLRGLPYYKVQMTQFRQRLHSELPLTRVWGYNGTYPGATFDTQQDKGIYVKWINNLPSHHLFDDVIDNGVHGCEPGVPHVRSVVHLHGAHIQPDSDGFPEAWFTSNPNAPANGLGGPAGNFAFYHYPNIQQAATLWYHDHSLGLTRLNVYSGLEGFYLLRDDNEVSLNLPSGPFEIPLMLQDRMFDKNGQLLYPKQGPVPDTWVLPDGTLAPPNTPGALPVLKKWIPEFFGDAILVNGVVWPFLEVEPRKYRFRILNASNARFFRIKLSSGQPFIQIGSDGGLLKEPTPVTELLVAPAERTDVIIDFTDYKSQIITMINDAPTPFPGGGDPNDPANNPNTAQVMQFRVKHTPYRDDSEVRALLNPTLEQRLLESGAALTRDVSLTELDHPVTDDPVIGQLGVVINNVVIPKLWMDPSTETPTTGTTEIWRIFNLTGDAHPIHIHLIQFQILDRQKLLTDSDGNPIPVPDLSSPPIPPNPNEMGWKDTVRTMPGMVTRIIAPFNTFSGKYVWHCHILEHEDNEMMRVMKVRRRNM